MTPSNQEALASAAVGGESIIVDDSLSVAEGVDEDEQSSSSSSFLTSVYHDLGAIANLCSATLGAGILAIPYGMYLSGLVFGGILLLVSGIATIFSIDLLIEATQKYRCRSYEDLVERALGKRSRLLTELSIVVSCIGVLVAYLIAVGDILETFVGPERRAVSMVIAWAVTMLPLSLLKTMDSLQWASSTGIISIFLLVVAALHQVLVDEAAESAHNLLPLLWPSNGITSVTVACPIVLFAFNCQVNVSSIYDEMSRKENMKTVTRASMSLCGILYLIMGLIGLWDFGSDMMPNILRNYHNTKSFYIEMAFLSMAVAIITASPMNVFPARFTIFGLMMPVEPEERPEVSDLEEPLLEKGPLENDVEQATRSESDDSGDSSISSLPSLAIPEPSLLSHVLVTVAISASSLGFALIVPNISVVFGLLGGTMGSFIGFVLPGACGVAIGRTSGWLLVVGGTFTGVLTTAVTVYSTFC